MNVLGIETSCDETAAAVVSDARTVLSSLVYSQVAEHAPYGGVVPEIAGRSHTLRLPPLIAEAVHRSGVGWSGLDAVAVTRGPGLASSLLVGIVAAEGLSRRLGIPLRGIHHLRAHLFSPFLGADAPDPASCLPMLALTVSGGHTCLVRVESPGTFRLLGRSLDDAAGEALDKGAAMLGLGYPGGPALERAAEGGHPHRVAFPRGLMQPDGDAAVNGLDAAFCFSFSGLKTALRHHLHRRPEALADPQELRDTAASYQEAVVDVLARKLLDAAARIPHRSLACVGGVASNASLRRRLEAAARDRGIPLLLAPPEFCTDNAAMVASLAARLGEDDLPEPPLDLDPSAPLA